MKIGTTFTAPIVHLPCIWVVISNKQKCWMWLRDMDIYCFPLLLRLSQLMGLGTGIECPVILLPSSMQPPYARFKSSKVLHTIILSTLSPAAI